MKGKRSSFFPGGVVLALLFSGCKEPNVGPSAVDDTALALSGASVDVDVLENDTDADGEVLVLFEISQGQNGAVAINPDSTVTYTPNAGFQGQDSFTYTASDPEGLFSTAKVSVTVNPALRLTILHNSDCESQLVDAGSGLEDFGGAARFATLVETLKAEALLDAKDGITRGVLMLSAGDNFLAGPEFSISLDLPDGEPFFDARAMELIGYDAITFGNHDFDFGPDVLEEFVESFQDIPFVSANLDFSQEPGMQALVGQGRVSKSIVLSVAGQELGVVGAITPELPFISSPRNTQVVPDLAGAIQAEVDALLAQGVDKILLVSHLQSLLEDQALALLLHDLDVMIGGGGDLLANPESLLIPGDEVEVFGAYPQDLTDAAGRSVPLVAVSGDYLYVGRLVVDFDAQGEIIAVDPESGPIRVAGGANPDAVLEDPELLAEVVTPIKDALAGLTGTFVGTSAVTLDGRRSSVRTRETNQGNLIVDAILVQATALAASFDAPAPEVALQNGGGIRNDTLIPPGDLSVFDTFGMLPFANFLAIVPDVPPAQFKEILENAYSRIEFTDGRFAHIAGFTVTVSLSGVAQLLDEQGNVTTPGSRVRDVTLDDGTPIVAAGLVLANAPSLHVATIDFLARSGDQYPFRNLPFVILGITYQQALAGFVKNILGGTVTAAAYPEAGEGRITFLP
jgi:2',3'-cyclic-nucleotide 2'-phosphodiesterase (5'-nucleotidase family)